MGLGLVFTHSASAFDLDKKLTDSGSGFGGDFGRSVSLSGNIALVGNTGHHLSAGSASVFDVNTGSVLRKFGPSDGAADDDFGFSVSLSRNTALVGSPLDDDNGNSSGSAYLVDVTTGNLLHKLTAPDGVEGDRFGLSVSLSGNTALVGSDQFLGSGNNTGSAYVFDVTTGNLLQKLTAPDGAGSDRFGNSVSLFGNIALVGSPGDDEELSFNRGSAYLFDVTTGNLLHKLIAPDGAANDVFGGSVSLFGNIALVGSPRDIDNGILSGSAYLFDVTTGTLLHKLTPPDGASGDTFGTSVSLSGNTALVGSDQLLNNGNNPGSAYLFDVTTGNFLQKLTDPDGAEGDQFGFSVSLSGNTALVGSPWDDNGSLSGSTFVFTNTSQKVPEPSLKTALVILGAGTAIRFGASFKRKLANNSKTK